MNIEVKIPLAVLQLHVSTLEELGKHLKKMQDNGETRAALAAGLVTALQKSLQGEMDRTLMPPL